MLAIVLSLVTFALGYYAGQLRERARRRALFRKLNEAGIKAVPVYRGDARLN